MIAVFRNPQGELLPVPKARTLAAIKRNYGKLPPERSLGHDGMAMRALQYFHQHMRGEETPFKSNLYNAHKFCVFSYAADGSRRVRAIVIDDVEHEIPHWDFVAAAEPTENAFN